MASLYTLPAKIDCAGEPEFLETILASSSGVRVERIVSWGHTTPEGEWYDQAWDEWVVILQGRACLAYAEGTLQWVEEGESVFLAKHVRHRVVFSSSPCIWLAIHGECLRE